MDREAGLTVQAIAEQGLLRRLQSYCPKDVIGDDGAVLTPQPGKLLVVTSDVLVDGVHFSPQTTRPEDAGWRAAAANLSDLAAMGATPLGITVGLALPGTVLVDWVERLYQGLTACLHQYNTVIVGGDVVRSPTITLAITAFGEVDPNRVIRRCGAKPGWAIVVTGVHGASRAGLELLLNPEAGSTLSSHQCNRLILAHQRPRPRLDLLPWLAAFGGNSDSAEMAIAGMDSSDGLADAIAQICRASNVGARVERSHIPMPGEFSNWISSDQAMQWTLYGGEDFELVLCLPQEIAGKLVDHLGDGAAIIGTTTVEPEVWLVDASHAVSDEPLSLEQGFQHFT